MEDRKVKTCHKLWLGYAPYTLHAYTGSARIRIGLGIGLCLESELGYGELGVRLGLGLRA